MPITILAFSTCKSCNGTGCNFCDYTGTENNNTCPVSGMPCDEKKNSCEPDFTDHGKPAYCHLK